MRRSKRGLALADEDSATKAMKWASIRNLDKEEGMNSISPVHQFNIQSSLNALGVSLGESSSAILNSVSFIKNVDDKWIKPLGCRKGTIEIDEYLLDKNNNDAFSLLCVVFVRALQMDQWNMMRV